MVNVIKLLREIQNKNIVVGKRIAKMLRAGDILAFKRGDEAK